MTGCRRGKRSLRHPLSLLNRIVNIQAVTGTHSLPQSRDTPPTSEGDHTMYKENFDFIVDKAKQTEKPVRVVIAGADCENILRCV